MTCKNTICRACGNQFQPKKKDSKFCSVSCYREAQRRGLYKRGSGRIHICKHCGGTVVGKSPSKTRSGKHSDHVFCNKECYLSYISDRRESGKRKECRSCGKSFLAHHKTGVYCSHKCRVDHKRVSPKECTACGTIFTPIKFKNGAFVGASSGVTCSIECKRAWSSVNPARRDAISRAMSGDRHPNWQGGSHYGKTRGPGWYKIAEECRDRHGRKCKACGMTEQHSVAVGWGRLQVNHIIPFWQWTNKLAANQQSNLEALCKSCHTKADWAWRKANAVQLVLPMFR